ncbi:MAG: RdgB/HAM1 family non-canonical purine NTP pyrophosphatase [Acidimicrobiales bacterium]
MGLTFVLATANAHKADEMRSVLAEVGIDVIARPASVPDVAETSDTLEGNALLKAHAICVASGQPAIADDTGLFVEALDGEPGVHSARYAGPSAIDADNVRKLLSELSEVDRAYRGARFRTVIAVAYPDGSALTVEGSLDGWIVDQPRGERGFGYDPVFASAELGGRTLAEVTADEKNAVSHRARALAALAVRLRS